MKKLIQKQFVNYKINEIITINLKDNIEKSLEKIL